MTAVAHRCQHCHEQLEVKSIDGYEMYESATARHHAVCPARSIAVGDPVSWESACVDRDGIHGIVERIANGIAYVRITWASAKYAGTFGPHCLREIHQPVTSLRRIPRPAEAQATVPMDDPDCVHGDAAWLYADAVRCEAAGDAPAGAMRRLCAHINQQHDPEAARGVRACGSSEDMP